MAMSMELIVDGAYPIPIKCPFHAMAVVFMGKHIIGKQLTAFEGYLRAEEREPGTIEKYLRDVRMMAGLPHVSGGARLVRSASTQE